MVYSYHTFVLPSIWEGDRGKKSKRKRTTLKNFLAVFENNPNWKCMDWNSEYKIPNSGVYKEDEEILLAYKEYQYLHPYVRRAIYGNDGNVVRNYSFSPSNVHNKGKYIITKEINGVTRNYLLHLNAIKLKIFNTGVALFIMECENHGKDEDGNKQTLFDDIKNINDYGRRISLPFISPKDGYSICADKLTVEIENVGTFEDDFKKFAMDLKNSKSLRENISMTHMCDYIKLILGYGSDKQFTSKLTDDKNKLYIYPALDDRMFVACACYDEAVANKMREPVGDGRDSVRYAFMQDEKLNKSFK